jgi:hypothetical protein
MGILGLRQINTCRKVPLQVNFLDEDIYIAYNVSLIFLRVVFTMIVNTSCLCV